MRRRPKGAIALAALPALAFALFLASATTAAALTYAPKLDAATGDYPRMLATGDFNADGHVDLAVGEWGSTLSVLLGKGDGTFQPRVTYATSGQPGEIAVADVDEDGHLDLVVADGSVDVYIGEGDGTFAAPVKSDAEGGAAAIALGDLNEDGHLDAVISAAYRAGVLLGNGDGTFGARTMYWDAVADRVRLGDMDGDGDVDVVTMDKDWYAVGVRLNDGHGSLGASARYGTIHMPQDIAVADVDEDGVLDVVAAGNVTAPDVCVFIGSGDGRLAQPYQVAHLWGPSSIAVGDVDGDGHPDIVTNDLSYNRVAVVPGSATASFSWSVAFPVGAFPAAVAIADFNDDQVPDLVAADADADTVSVLLASWMPVGTVTLGGSPGTTLQRDATISAQVTSATQMRVRDAGGDWAAWRPFDPALVWTLPAGDGVKTVQVQYRNGHVTDVLDLTSTTLLDYLPPVTSDDAPSWTHRDVAVRLSAIDGGTGVAYTKYRVDGGPWVQGTSATVVAPPDHSADGAHKVEYFSIDQVAYYSPLQVAHVEAVKSATIRVDTIGPATRALNVATRVRKPALLRYLITDAQSKQASDVRIVVRDRAGRKVKTLLLGTQAVSPWLLTKWTPRARGTYRFSVFARDAAGNDQSVLGSARISVR